MSPLARCIAVALLCVVPAACKDIGGKHTTTIENRTDLLLSLGWKDNSGSGGGEARIGPHATITQSFYSRGKCAMLVDASNFDEMQPGVIPSPETRIVFSPEPWCYKDTLFISRKPASP